MRLSDPQFLKVIDIHPVGDKGTIQKAMQALAGKGIPIAAVRDGDVGQNPGQNLFSLPGKMQLSEKEVLQKCPEVAQMLIDEYGLNLQDFMVGADPGEHHGWFSKLSATIACESAVVVASCAAESTPVLLAGQYQRRACTTIEGSNYTMKEQVKRLIEVDLPIKRISNHARREKSIRHGHISTLHMWWARRPLAACRWSCVPLSGPTPQTALVRRNSVEGR